MINTRIARVVLRVFVAAVALTFFGLADTPIGVTAAASRALNTSAALTSAPVFNDNQPVLNSGPNVVLSWAAPAIGLAISYLVEASSQPGGPPDIATFNTGNALTSLFVPNVPAGIYYVRIRALDENGWSAPSNEVQLVVVDGSCSSAPRGFSVVSQDGGTVVFGWQPPLTGAPTSYVIQAGSFSTGSDLANFDTQSTAVTLTVSNVPAGSYFVRVYARSSGCTPPAFLGPASNEILVSVGPAGPRGWSGAIVCRTAIRGSGYRHDETQTWIIGGTGQTVGPRTFYRAQWSAQGSGGGPGTSWTINSTATTDFTVTTVASTGIPFFDRTTAPIIIRGGIVGSPTSFDLYEMEFPAVVAGSATATSVSTTWSRPTVGGDSPQQPADSIGTLTCTVALTYR